MIVNRWVWTAVPGRRDEFAELLKAEVERSSRNPTRIYVPDIGPRYNTVVMEIDCEDLRDYEQGWAEWFADPEAAEWMRRTEGLVSDFHTEIWRRID